MTLKQEYFPKTLLRKLMIKKFFFVFLFLFIFILIILFIFNVYFKNNDNGQSNVLPENNPEYEDVNSENSYSVHYLEVNEPENIVLISNIDLDLTSDEAMQKYGCNQIISAGFIDKDKKHLGLFVEEGKIISKTINSTLLNGFIGYGKNWYISENPEKFSKYLLQSGPIIQQNNNFVNLDNYKISHDRRVLAGLSRKGLLTFVIIYTKNNTISGPSFQEIPGVMNKMEKDLPIDFVDLINLDGGSHSFFITSEIKIPEISKSGGFFCIK